MTNKEPVRIALIGYGYVGKAFHAPLIQSVAGLELRVVNSRNADAVQQDWPDVEVVNRPENAITHPEVDLVVIASRTKRTSRWPRPLCARANMWSWISPFTITLAEARNLGPDGAGVR